MRFPNAAWMIPLKSPQQSLMPLLDNQASPITVDDGYEEVEEEFEQILVETQEEEYFFT